MTQEPGKATSRKGKWLLIQDIVLVDSGPAIRAGLELEVRGHAFIFKTGM